MVLVEQGHSSTSRWSNVSTFFLCICNISLERFHVHIYTWRNVYNVYTAAFDNDMNTYVFIFTLRYISNIDKIQTSPLQHGNNEFWNDYECNILCISIYTYWYVCIYTYVYRSICLFIYLCICMYNIYLYMHRWVDTSE